MKFETLINLVGSILFALLGVIAIVGVVLFGAWWHIFTGLVSFIVSLLLFFTTDVHSCLKK